MFCLATNQIAQTGLSSLPPVIYYSEQLFSIAFSSTVDSDAGTSVLAWVAVDAPTGLLAGSADTLSVNDSPYFAIKYCCSSIASVCSWVTTVDWLIAAIKPPLYWAAFALASTSCCFACSISLCSDCARSESG
ncbi:hypothetical protein EHZ61_15130 [Aeromonas caviae]|nr:hypothetical protein EHZ61_15130 [Aeromonas caviae]